MGSVIGSAGSVTSLHRLLTEEKKYSKDLERAAFKSLNLSVLLFPCRGMGEMGLDRVLSVDGWRWETRSHPSERVSSFWNRKSLLWVQVHQPFDEAWDLAGEGAAGRHTRIESWLPFRWKTICTRLILESLKNFMSLMQSPYLMDLQGSEKIQSPDLVNWGPPLDCRDPTNALWHGERC